MTPDTGSGASQLNQTGASSLSADGRYLVFASTSENMVPGQASQPNSANVFLRDQVTGTTTLVSHLPGLPDAIADGGSDAPTISADGRYIVYRTTSNDLVPGQVAQAGPATTSDVMLYDRLTGQNTLISHMAGAATTGGNGQSVGAVISADGSTIAFVSNATDLVAGQSQSAGSNQIFLYSVATGTTTLVTHAFNSTTTASGNVDYTTNVSFSANGRFLAFASYGTSLIAGQVDTGNNGNDVFLYDQTTNASTLVSHTTGSNLIVSNSASFDATISADGSSIAFQSYSTDLVSGQVDTPVTSDVFLYSAATGNITLVSHVAGSAATAAMQCWSAVISADGNSIAYISLATDLVTGQTGPANGSLFLYDCITGTSSLVSHAVEDPLSTANGPSIIFETNQVIPPAMSADGRFVVYLTQATNLIANPPNAGGDGGDEYLYDRTTGTNTLLTPTTLAANLTGHTDSGRVAISADGSTVAFESRAGVLPTGLLDDNLNWDVFLYGTASGQLSIASVRDPGNPEVTANAGSNDIPVTTQMVSSDGRYVVMTSAATNLVQGQIEQNSGTDIFLADRATGTVYLVSHIPGSDVTTMQSPSTDAVLSANGEFVAFVNSSWVYLYDLATQDVTVVSHPAGSPNSLTFTGASSSPVISADGQYVAYLSGASDLVPGFVDNDGGDQDVFLFDRLTGTNVLVSHTADSATTTVDQGSGAPTISADGSTVAFGTFATDVVSGQLLDSNNSDLFAYNVATGTNVMVSHAVGSTVQGVGYQGPVVMSDDGATIVYLDSSNLLVGGPLALGYKNVVLYNRATGVNQLVTQGIDPANNLANGDSWDETISGDGQTIYFDSSATNLIAGFVQVNPVPEVYAYDRKTDTISLISHSAGSPTTGGIFTSADPETTEDGDLVVFRSQATDLISGFTKVNGAGAYDLYLYDRQTGTTTLLSHSMASPTTSANDSVTWANISADGSTTRFGSAATDLVPGDFNSTVDVFTSSGNLAPPPPVSGLTTTPGNGSVTLNWTAAPGVYGYDIYRTPVASPSALARPSSLLFAPLAAALAQPESTTGGSGTVLVQAAVAGTSFTDTGLANGTEYSYEVTAINSAGAGAPSTKTIATPQPPTGTLAWAVDAGGGSAGNFQADTGFSGGKTYSATAAINTSSVSNPAPQSVYQTERYGNFSYTPTGLTPGATYTVRLHFAELYWTGAGQRLFNVTINGQQVLRNFDIFAQAGGKDIAIVESFTATADASGTITIGFVSVKDNAKVSGIEIVSVRSTPTAAAPVTGLAATAGNAQLTLSWTASTGATGYNVYRGTISGSESATPIATGVTGTSFTDTSASNGTTYYYEVTATNTAGESARSAEVSATPKAPTSTLVWAVDAGGAAAGNFLADTGFTGGKTYSTTAAVSTGAVSSPAPQAVYQTERYGNFSYSAIGLTPGASYTVRLHFAELYWTSAGSREFNVTINGQQVLTNFDIFATAGGKDIAIIKPFTATANSSGQIVITFTSVKDNAKVSGIEILTTGVKPTPPAPVTGLSAGAGNAQVTLNWAASSTATSYNVYRGSSNGGEVLVKSGVSTTSYTDTGLSNGTTYFYEVTAVNSAGESGRSSEVSATPQATAWAVDAGGGAAGNFKADTGFTGGTAYSTTAAINTSGVSNPAPQTVYQTERFGNFSYKVTGLTPGASYTVRLHFAELYWNSAGSRRFNVTINGTQVLTNFDIFQQAGGKDIAIVESFTATADSTGAITIGFVSVKDNAKVSGIEIVPISG
jgi:fibronectin type 3 domain-containing protein